MGHEAHPALLLPVSGSSLAVRFFGLPSNSSWLCCVVLCVVQCFVVLVFFVMSIWATTYDPQFYSKWSAIRRFVYIFVEAIMFFIWSAAFCISLAAHVLC